MGSDILKDYAAYLRLECSRSSNTVSAYVRDVEAFRQWTGGSFSGVRSSDVSDYFASRKTLSKRSQARSLSSIRSFYDWAILEGYVKTNPCDNMEGPKLGRYLPVVLSEDEVEALISSVDTTTDLGRRDRAILETLYGCGLRVSELVSLTLSNVFLSEGIVRVIGKGDKQRLVPMGDCAANAIASYLEVRRADPKFDDVLFVNRYGRPLSRVSVFNLMKSGAIAAGIGKEISPHTLRHSFATHLIEHGADIRSVQEMLGHESILTTEIYTHIDKSTWQSSVMERHPINNKTEIQ